MRISTQIAIGYLLAVAAAAAIGLFSLRHVNSIGDDLSEIAEEWGEHDAVVGSLASMREAVRSPETRGRLLADANALARLVHPGRPGESSHDSLERHLFADLSGILDRAAAAPEQELAALEDEAQAVALSFWLEDRGRVPRRVAEIHKRRRYLRRVDIAIAGGILLLPLILLGYLQLRILKPLARIQHRVEALGGDAPREARRGGAMAGLAAAIEDMALTVERQRENLEQQVETRTLQLRHADRLGGLGRIAAAVAHEINNPLGSIGLCVEGMARGLREDRLDTDEIARHIDTMGAEIERCQDTTRKLLTYAHYREPQREDVAVGHLVQEAVDLVAGQARLAGVGIDISDTCGGELVRTDAGQVRQVLVNLLLNALDASKRGDVIGVDLSLRDDDLVLRVRDSGPGVAPEHREDIFSPFFTTKRPGEGTGLGLSISREIIEGHGGTLELVPGGAGAVFEARLPRVQEGARS